MGGSDVRLQLALTKQDRVEILDSIWKFTRKPVRKSQAASTSSLPSSSQPVISSSAFSYGNQTHQVSNNTPISGNANQMHNGVPNTPPSSGNGEQIQNDPTSISAVPNPAPEIDQQANGRKNYMPLILYYAATKDNADHFIDVIEDIILANQGLDFSKVTEQVTPSGNTVLHVAASHGNEEVADLIAVQNPSLVMKQNSVGDTALHLAVRAGHEPVIRSLLKIASSNRTTRNLTILRVRNREGNTALHEFVMSKHYYSSIMSESLGCSSAYSIFNLLINEDPEVCCLANNEGKSALYLAAEAGREIFVKDMLVIAKNQNCDELLLKGKSPLLPVIIARNKALSDIILQYEPAFISLTDEEGKTPLHYAASVGYTEMTQSILKKDEGCTLERDNSGFFPVHVAAAHGHIQAMMELLKHSPEPEEMLTSTGQNILHVAAARGNYNVIRFLLQKFARLNNERDGNGNTPLHLATMNWHPKVVSAMTWNKRVDLTVVNNEGLTALDIAEYNMGETYSYEKRLTWIALETAGASRAPKKETPKLSSRDSISEGIPPKTVSHTDRYRDRVNTLLVVATLVATVTFAAGFTMPGGNDEESDANQGMATMLQKKAFHVFVLCDTIAMLCSTLVVISLIWAQLGDLKLVLMALRLAIPLLGVGLVMMSLAFMAGVYLVVTQLNWLAYAVLIIGFVFLASILVLLLPLCLPLYSQNRILRYITYYPFYVFVLLTVKSEGMIAD